uniref:hypothetical protein n=1 Tax=Lactobacillus acidophilus TaxID=1579 RepID=UPI003F577161
MEKDKYTETFTQLIDQLKRTTDSWTKADKQLIDLVGQMQDLVDYMNTSTKELANITANSDKAKEDAFIKEFQREWNDKITANSIGVYVMTKDAGYAYEICLTNVPSDEESCISLLWQSYDRTDDEVITSTDDLEGLGIALAYHFLDKIGANSDFQIYEIK